MKKTKLLGALLVAAVLLTACGSDDELMRRMSSMSAENTTEAAYGDSISEGEKTETEPTESEKTETGAMEETTVEDAGKDISYPENLVVDYEEYSYDIDTSIQLGHYSWRFPYINYDSEVCEEVNNEIKNFAELNYSDTTTAEDDLGEHTWLKCHDGVWYSWGRCGDVLSLLVYGAGSYGGEVEYVYNYYINLRTDELLDNEEFARYVTGLGVVTDAGESIDYDGYKDHIRASIEKGLKMDFYMDEDGNETGNGTRKENELTLSQSNVDASYAYLSGTQLMVCYMRYEADDSSYTSGYTYQTYWDTGMYVLGD